MTVAPLWPWLAISPQRRVQEAQANLSESEVALQQAMGALRLSGMPAVTIDRECGRDRSGRV